MTVLDEIAATAGDPGAPDSYGELQELVGLRARLKINPTATRVRDELSEGLTGCLEGLRSDMDGSQRLDEADLECWEVALGMAAFATAESPRSFDLVVFVEAALEHEYWIVRWWAFANLVAIFEHSCRQGHRVLARRLARRAVGQLYTAVEPMGIKHRQCTVLKELRDGDDEAGLLMREALAATAAPRRTEAAGQALAERYYEAMGVSPDTYLAEFFRRLDGLILLPA